MFFEKPYKSKPTGAEIGKIQNGFTQNEIEIEELATALSNGATFKPALLNGSKSADFISQQLFALDFDENTTVNEELNRCKELNINPVFGYTSFSHTKEHHKFRLVFCADRVITNMDERNKVQHTLMELFINVDIKCKDISRLFFGGRELIANDYKQRIDIDWLLKTYSLSLPQDIKENIKPVKPKKETARKQQVANYNTYDNELIRRKVDAISTLNVSITRGFGVQDITTTNKKDFSSSSISGEFIQQPLSIETPILVGSTQEVFDVINNLDLNSYLGIPEGKMVNCILPEHNDRTPSVHIFITDSGTPVYKCFGCDKTRTMIGITEELAHCKRSEAIEFIKAVYNIKLVQSDWVKEQKQLMIDSANYIDTEEFKIEFPELSKLIRTRKIYIQKMLMHFTQYVSDNLNVDGKPLFFASYDTLATVCGIRKDDRRKLSQTLILFSLLNMLDKVETEKIPDEELRKAKSIAAKYGHEKLTGFYQFQEYGILQLNSSETKAKILKENNMTLAGLSREYVLRTFGNEVADKVFPQYKYENSFGTTIKSDERTMKLVNKIAKKIEKKGYCLESDIKKNKQDATQWRKSIADILNSYDWKKLKLNNELKEKFGITAKGYPFLIVNN